jgi:hypothetical protein
MIKTILILLGCVALFCWTGKHFHTEESGTSNDFYDTLGLVIPSRWSYLITGHHLTTGRWPLSPLTATSSPTGKRKCTLVNLKMRSDHFDPQALDTALAELAEAAQTARDSFMMGDEHEGRVKSHN